MASPRTSPSFAEDESGFGTLWNIFWCICFLLIGGLVIDHANAMRIKMALQATADSAALGAIMVRSEPSKYESYFGTAPGGLSAEQRGQAAAISLSTNIMGTETNGSVLDGADVKFGTWTKEGGFVTGAGDFAQVTTYRADRNDNALQMLLLDAFTPLKSWDVAAQAVAQRYRPDCAKDGVITSDVVDLQSNSKFKNGICVHGGKGVELNRNDVFDPGVIVQMPDLALLKVPGGDTSKNTGLDAALREGTLAPGLAMQTDEIITGLQDISSEWQPDYVSGNPAAQLIDVTESAFDPANLVEGNVYRVTCNGGNGTLNLRGKASQNALGPTDITFAKKDNGGGKGGGGDESGGPSIIEEVVIVTNCQVTFSQETVIQNAIVATSDTSAKSVSGSASVSIGRPDNCAPGGGAQIVTAGGMHFAAKMEFHGSQLVSKGPVKLAAQVDGIGGTSIQSLSRVDFASNNEMGLCEGEADEVLPLNYYRLVD
ncbi:Tad domain-containing protein [Oceanibium sediminis]|uniref:Tad domain-containing protein n=1 Tax=Oceanibium sediminis TaxID=2026339 RepID=UPI000DD3480D|nr:Tad domain-containing protein [Oceanibium sediminis]